MSQRRPRAVGLLTDYGAGSEHVGALHAVIAAARPGVERIDLAHDLPLGDARWGAIVLARLAPLLPGAVLLAVVDPGVGTERRALAVSLADGGALVGPDNGLLGPAARALGATAAVRLTSPEHRRHPVSPTFHGRDVFAPAAAHLCAGGALSDLGEPVAPDSIRMPDLPSARPDLGRLAALAVGVDRFGNVALLAGARDLERAGLGEGDRVRVVVTAGAHPGRVGRIFADVAAGGLLVHVDSSGMVALAVNGASAAERLGLGAAGWVVVERALG